MRSTNSRRIFGRGLRFGVLAAGFLIATQAIAGITSVRVLSAIARETPRVALVASGQQMEHAAAAAAAIPGAIVGWGAGDSMAPLYSGRTAVVIAPVKFSALKAGMTVVYVDRHGLRVAHALIGNLPKGWVAQGVHNDWEDDDLVTPANLVGVVVQAYAPRES